MSVERIDWSPCKESRAGFTPAPSPPCEVSTNGVGGGGGFSFSQIAAQRALIAKRANREAVRPDQKWGQG